MLRQLERQQFRCMVAFTVVFLGALLAMVRWTPYRAQVKVVDTGNETDTSILHYPKTRRRIVHLATGGAPQPGHLFDLSARRIPETSLVSVSATATDPALAVRLAEFTAEQLVGIAHLRRDYKLTAEAYRLQQEALDATQDYEELTVPLAVDPRARKEFQVGAERAVSRWTTARRRLDENERERSQCFSGPVIWDEPGRRPVVSLVDCRTTLGISALFGLVAAGFCLIRRHEDSSEGNNGC